MEELLDVYTRDGTYIGKKVKSSCYSNNNGFYHKPVWIWIINNKGQVLVQKRASSKKYYPDKWDMSCTGHVNAGETQIEGAIREIYEELGIKTVESDYKFICEYIYDPSYELGQVYLLNLNSRTDEFRLQENEVSEIKWLNFDDFKKLLYSEQFVKLDEEYRKLVLNMLKHQLQIK